MKPLSPAGRREENENKEQVDERNTPISSTSRKLSKQEKSLERVPENGLRTSLSATPIKNQQSNETIAFNEADSSSMNVRLSPVETPQMMSTTDTLSPESIQSKEMFSPVGAKYQSKTRQVKPSTFSIE